MSRPLWLVLLLVCPWMTEFALAQRALPGGAPVPFRFAPQSSSELFNGDDSFQIEVPDDAAGLFAQVTTLRAESTLSFHVRQGEDVVIGAGGVTADVTVTESQEARVWTLEAQTLPPGTYFIAISAGPFQQELRGTIYAKVLAAPARKAAEVDVPGMSRIHLAGQPAGVSIGNSASAPENSPVLVQAAFEAGQRVRFTANGTIDSTRLGRDIPPEGQQQDDSPNAEFGISGVNGPRDALVGVFAGDVIDDQNTPPGLQYTRGGKDAAIVEPMLQQTFYIGNGFTPSGRQREFIVPEGATRLFVGTKSLFPNTNTGEFHVSVAVDAAGERPAGRNPLIVPAIANLVLAGQPVGTVATFDTVPMNAPPRVNIPLEGGQRLQFTARGQVRTRNNRVVGPEGANRNANAGLNNGFSGVVSPEGGLIGVFTADVIDEDERPSRLTFDAELRNEPVLRPELQQMFYIGDGRTEDGERRTVVVPAGATRFYLGVHIGRNNLNEGEFFVIVSVDDPGAPDVPGDGVVNGAGFIPGAISPGGVVSIFGQNLARAQRINSRIPLPAELGGVQVFFDEHPAVFYFVSAGQVNVQAPWELKGRVRAWVTVVRDGVAGEPVEVEIEPFRPGIFVPPPVVINNRTGDLVSVGEPARAGDALIVFTTGLGPVAPEFATGAPPPAGSLTRATFEVQAILTGGGDEVVVRPFFAGGAPNFVGVHQVNFIVPEDAPRGSVMFRLRSAGFASTQEVEIFIE